MEYSINVLLIGDKNVGVSTIVDHFVGKSNPPNPVDKELEIDGSIISHVKFQIWRFNDKWEIKGIQFNYQVISGAIVVFDVTNKDSIDNLDNWVKKIGVKMEKE